MSTLGAPTQRVICILVSSPGDVLLERERSRQVIAQLQRFFGDAIRLQPLLWEDLPLQPDTSFQQGIELVLSERHRVDIAIFIFWARLGSTVGGKLRRADGSQYLSGTERELDLMLAARKQTNGQRPKILVYRREDDDGFKKLLAPLPVDEIDELVEQRRRLNTFIKRHFEDEQGSNRGAILPYKKPSVFARRLKTHLRDMLIEMLDQADGGQTLREITSRRWKSRLARTGILIATAIIAVLTTAWYIGGDFGTLAITTDPPGATISLGEHNWGVTPYRKYVPQGFWEVQIQKAGFLTQTVQVQIAKSRPAKYEFSLRPFGVSSNGIAKLSSDGGRLISVEGSVEVSPAGTSVWIPVAANLVLYPGDSVRTGAHSTAALLMNDRTCIRLIESTEYKLLPRRSDTSPINSLRTGLMYFFSRDRKTEFQIRTKLVSTGING